MGNHIKKNFFCCKFDENELFKIVLKLYNKSKNILLMSLSIESIQKINQNFDIHTNIWEKNLLSI